MEHALLSNYDSHFFLENYTDSNTVPSNGTFELNGITDCSVGEITKDVKTYRTLNGDGWESVASLGQSISEFDISLVREGTGDVYDGTAGSSTFTKLKKWFLDATAHGGSNAPKCLIEVIPRGDNDYEGNCYYVYPSKWNGGKKDTETAQEYSITVKPFGPVVPITVTKSTSGGTTTWSFAKI